MNDTRRYMQERQVGRRLLVQSILELASPAHLGGNDPISLTDQPILRDHFGAPFIPGATLTGVLRSYMNLIVEAEQIKELFGCPWDEENEDQSPLIIDDAPIMETQQGITELRDGVKIDSKKGVADAGKKFDMEFLPVGTSFRLSFELLLKGTDSDRLELFFTALDALERGIIQIGARNRRGYGKCKAHSWKYQYFDVSTIEGLLQWLANEGGVPESWQKAPMRQVEHVKDIADEFSVSIISPKPIPKISIILLLRCPGSLLVRSGGYEPGEADAVHLHRIHIGRTSRIPVLSGTSLGGVLRQRALKIAKTLDGTSDKSKSQHLIDEIFGTEMGPGKTPRASRVHVDEAVIENSKLLRHARVLIDRWRGSSLEHMLFEEDALFDARVKVKWEHSHPKDAEIGLMLCLVKDLFSGDLPVGGESSVGRGVLYGEEGIIEIIDSSGSSRKITLKGDGNGWFTVTEGSASTEIFFTRLSETLEGGKKWDIAEL